jgi:uncharacterized membrane protein
VRSLQCVALGVLLVAAVGYILATTGSLPATVATHFDGNGRPNGWMTREGYRAFLLAFTIGLPLFVAAAIGWLPSRFPRAINLPNREHWFAAEHRDAALAYLARHGCLLGCVMVLFSAAIHALILDAHAHSPPLLASEGLLWVLVVFVIAITAWAFSLFRRFGVRRA